MSVEELMKLRASSDAPFNHQEYTVWLHNKIVDKINYELWEFRERQSGKIQSPYVACNHIMSLPSLQKATE
jgi:hypothetical protein